MSDKENLITNLNFIFKEKSEKFSQKILVDESSLYVRDYKYENSIWKFVINEWILKQNLFEDLKITWYQERMTELELYIGGTKICKFVLECTRLNNYRYFNNQGKGDEAESRGYYPQAYLVSGWKVETTFQDANNIPELKNWIIESRIKRINDNIEYHSTQFKKYHEELSKLKGEKNENN